MSKNDVWRQTEVEIAAKYPGELTDAMLALREAPAAGLRRRVAAISDQESRRRKVNTPPSVFRRRLMLAVVVLLLAVGALFAVPQWRAAVAQGAAELWRMIGFGMSTSPESVVTFRPAPLFDVYQPASLPPGYTLKTQTYQQGGGQSLTEEQVTDNDEADKPASRLGERLQHYEIDEPHVILVYHGDAGDDYLLLFQRAARQDETLPPGEAHTVAQWPAVLARDGNSRILSWVAGKTWIVLEGTLQEDELLRVAERLTRTQGAAEADLANTETVDEPPDLSAYPYCDPSEGVTAAAHSAATPMQGQRFGSVRITFSEGSANPERVSFGSSAVASDITPFTERELLQQAIEALQEPDLMMEPLSLRTIVVELEHEEECLRRVPVGGEEDFISIEIADEKVTVGFGGEGDRYVDRAISALERELVETH